MNLEYYPLYKPGSTRYICLHHTGGLGDDYYAHTQHLTVDQINNAHQARWPDFKSSLGYYVGYNFVIEKDGKITQTRAIGEETAHTKGFNTSSIGICLTGNFASNEKPTLEQILALKNLMQALPSVHYSRVVPHRYLQTSTVCNCLPGDWGRKIYLEVIREKINLIQKMLLTLLDLIQKSKFKVGAQYLRCEDVAKDYE